MKDIKSIVAHNITELRIQHNLTQMELAEKLCYSDKTISKWERAESSPDISVLAQIASLFGVSLDRLVSDEEITEADVKAPIKAAKYSRRVISYIAEASVWILATLAFIITSLIIGKMEFQWLYFVYSLPVMLIVKLVLNTLWFNPRRNYLIISAFVWSVLLSVHATFLYFKMNVALIYLLGVVVQIVIVMWSFLKKTKV
jgi:transcriptional regulator with XRE-family HTH domain